MSETGTSPPVSALANRAALRLVLFGMPDAGKSSLLGALGQAGHTQEHLLNGHLTDLSHGLAELQRRLYEEAPRETLEEIVPYPTTFEPFTSPAGDTARKQEAVLVDCDGRVANELLARRRSLTRDGEGTLAQAILQADTLILAVDASAPPAQVDADFAEFGRFLRLLVQSRGQRTDVGGLPVFLVLTKCDLLAQAHDTPAAWMERIEDRKRQVDRRFQEFLARASAEGPAPFGTIDLHLWATAVKRPELAGSPARPHDPYGVAELFRQCLESAGRFRERRNRSGRRLLWTVGGTAGVLAALVALATGLLATRQDGGARALETRIASYRAHEGTTPAARLHGPLADHLDELKELRSDPAFDKLATDDQDYVRTRLEEMQQYVAYKEKLDELQRSALANVHGEADLDQLETRLATELAIPPPFATDWAQSEAVLLRLHLLKSIQGIRDAQAESQDWYRRLLRQEGELRTFARIKPSDARSWADWLGQADALLGQTFSHAENEELSNAGPATYATVFRFEKVHERAQQWDKERQHLQDLRDVVAALGLAGTLPDGQRQPLDIPDHFPMAQAHTHWQNLERLYPKLPSELASSALPDAVAGSLRRAARASYDHLIEAGRQVTLKRLRQTSPNGEETPELWRGLRDWLTSTGELHDWRRLAALLSRFQDSSGKDPVTALADFLRQDHFVLEILRLTLEIPFDHKVRPAGSFSIHHATAASPDNQTDVFKLLDDDGRRDPQRRVTLYTFVRESSARIDFRPGDSLYADLPVKREAVAGDWVLTWGRRRSLMYQFERLLLPPRLHRKDQDIATGELLDDITLAIIPEGGIPPVPDLVPTVDLK